MNYWAKLRNSFLIFTKIKGISFRIEHIIDSDDIHIKHLHYEENEVSELDLSILSTAEQQRLHSFTAERRKVEFYYTRLLWKSFGFNEFIRYTAEGSPLVSNGQISISHSRHHIVIGRSVTHSIGIDIENYSEKVIRVCDKFMSEKEIERFGQGDKEKLTTIWSIKEAVFKMRPKDHLNFKEQIEVLKLDEDSCFTIHYSDKTEHFRFYMIPMTEAVVTYCLAKI